MDPTVAITCEYLFGECECTAFLRLIGINETKYEYIYKKYTTSDIIDKRRIRKLIDVKEEDLTQYTNVMSIKFDHTFNERIILPNNIVQLVLGHDMNQPFTIPTNLKWLELGHDFDCQLSMLPHTLTVLIFGYRYRQTIPTLPKGLTTLFIKGFQQINKLPDNITRLLVRSKLYTKVPPKVTHLEWQSFLPIPMLPSSLTHLILGDYPKIRGCIPALVYLNVHYDFKRKFIKLPSSLKHLSVDLSLVETVPKYIFNDFNHKMNILPTQITTFKWNCYVSSRVDCDKFPINFPPKLPSGLITLNINNEFNHQISTNVIMRIINTQLKIPTLPVGLQHLELRGDYYNISELSNNIQYLILGRQRRSSNDTHIIHKIKKYRELANIHTPVTIELEDDSD
jgi:hypothetical protein